ncbi:MAG: membrane protein insertase YidC [Candidatus Bipolaricaulota bacterium]
MAKRRIAYVGFVLGIVLLSLAAGASQRDITYVTLQREGWVDLEVMTPLARIILSEDRGSMKSVFLSFAPYGSTVAELVPGARTDVKTFDRQFVEGAVFPFSVSSGSEGDGLYRLTDVGVDAADGTFRATFEGAIGRTSVRKTYVISPEAMYTLQVSITVTNGTSTPLDLVWTVADLYPKDNAPEAAFLFDDEPGAQPLARGSYASFGGAGLLGDQTVFFVSPKGGSAGPYLERTQVGSQHIGFTLSVDSGATVTFESELYAGRRRYLLMDAAGLGPLDQPGLGARMMIPVIQFLDLLYRATGNYGWAIILFTILTRVLLYPLMRKQIHSMAKMQRLQPKMKQIQERFKDDRQLMQQRLMELYRKEGINPMGGCLPMVVQLPIIFVIWRAILYAGESIHLSPGFLWMPDLSLHDPYFVLVVVTTAIMIFQQWKLTPSTSEGGPTAKYFGYVFPVLMAILLWRFPAGLWLYYLLTTAVQAAQQALVNRELARADRMAAETSAGDVIDVTGHEDGRGQAGS